MVLYVLSQEIDHDLGSFYIVPASTHYAVTLYIHGNTFDLPMHDSIILLWTHNLSVGSIIILVICCSPSFVPCVFRLLFHVCHSPFHFCCLPSFVLYVVCLLLAVFRSAVPIHHHIFSVFSVRRSPSIVFSFSVHCHLSFVLLS